MSIRYFLLGLALSASLAVAKHAPKIGDGQAANTAVNVEATIYADPESVAQQVGSDLQGHYTIVRVKLTPKNGKLPIQLDDFLLWTDKDGERSHPFVASQIAGPGALIISETLSGGGVRGGDPNGPVWGGMPGTGTRPQQMPGNGAGVGNTAATTENKTTVQSSDKKDPLMNVLTAKMLKEGDINEPVSGLLYFPLEKQKVKDLQLFYTTSAGKLSIRFK